MRQTRTLRSYYEIK